MSQQLLNGLMLGGVYALFAVGLTLSLGVLRVLNNAHGVTLALAAIAAVKLSSDVSVPFPLLVIFGGIVGAGVGVVLEFIAFRPLRKGFSERNTEMMSLVSSLGMLFVLQAVAQNWTHAQPVSFSEEVFHSTRIGIGSLSVASIQLVMFVTAVVLVIACWWVLSRTQGGRAARGVAMDDVAAGMIGINANLVKLVTMCASGALAGIAGVLIGVSLGTVDYTMGESQLLKGFAVVILGGIGSVPGALIGGLLLGLGEGVAVQTLGSSWQPAVAFFFLIVILIVRPQGLFGRPEVDRA